MLAALGILAILAGTGLAANDAVTYANMNPTPIVQQINGVECYDVDGDGWVNYACECTDSPVGEAFPEE